MTNANIALMTQNNTFGNWLSQSNSFANVLNSLLNGLFYADNGSIMLANGTITLLGLSGVQTLLSVSGNATISGNVTAANGTFSQNVAAGNVAITALVQAANAVITNNVNVSNLNVSTQAYVQNANVLGTLNVATLAVSTLTVASEKVATLNVTTTANLQQSSLLANNIQLDNGGSYSIIQGNAVLDNLTVQGNQTIVGLTILSSNTIQLRNNLTTDGIAKFEVFRGSGAGPFANVNAAVQFTNTSNVWQMAANDAQTFQTILGTSNIADSVSNNSTIYVASANSVEWAFNTAQTSANTVATSNNGALVLSAANLNFNTSPTINAIVAANGTGQVNVSFSVNASAAGGPPYAQANAAYAQANLAYAAANVAANQTQLLQNGSVVVSDANVNFNNSATLNVSVTSNAPGQGNIAFTVNALAAVQGAQNTWVLLANTSGANATANLVFDYGNNMLGVGQSTPRANVDVNGTVRANNFQEHYNNVGTPVLQVTNASAYWTGQNTVYYPSNGTMTTAGGGGALVQWDKTFYSVPQFATGTISFQIGAGGGHMMVGFCSNPVTLSSIGSTYYGLDWALYYAASSQLAAYSNSAQVQSTGGGAANTNAILKISFDGTTMRAYVNNQLAFSNTAYPNGTPFSAVKNFSLAVCLYENGPNVANGTIVNYNGYYQANVDCRQGDFQDITLVNNLLIQMNNAPATGNTQTTSLWLRQTTSTSTNGNWGMTFANTMWWSDNLQPALTATQNAADLIVVKTYNNGSRWLGSQAMGNVAGANVY